MNHRKTKPKEGEAADAIIEAADEDVGAPSEWYSRGYLPHRDPSGLLQAVTFRLADSLPKERLTQLEDALRLLPDTHREVEHRKKIKTWLDSGMGCRALRHPELAKQVQDALLHFHNERYTLIAWCIMPNHMHVLLETVAPIARSCRDGSPSPRAGPWRIMRNYA